MLEFCELEEPQPFSPAEQQAIEDLKLLCRNHLHIDFQTDNFFFTKFLRYRDWSVQAAYEAIVNNYELKVNNSNSLISKSGRQQTLFGKIRLYFIA